MGKFCLLPGTPPLPTGESDTRYVEAVARGIGAHLNGGYKLS